MKRRLLSCFRLLSLSLLGVGIGASVAGVGAVLIGKPYLSSYLETKGKNLATREDVQQILDELHKTETLKSEISQRVWLRQQQWATREKHYLSLLEGLTRFCISLLDRIDYFLEPDAENNQEIGSWLQQARTAAPDLLRAADLPFSSIHIAELALLWTDA